MAPTYLYGYGNGPHGSATRKTAAEIRAVPQFAQVDGELMDRLFALCDAVIAAGGDYGFGGGARTTQSQLTLFLGRHTQVATGGCCGYDGKRYALKAGMAHAAPPGRSFHEPTTKALKALAVDMIGTHTIGNLLARVHGLRHFADINAEPWHYQPLEISVARQNYVGPDPLPELDAVPPTPPPTDDEDDMRQFQPENDPAVFAVSGLSATWVKDEATRDALAFLGAGAPIVVPRRVLSALVLDGPLPVYDAGDPRAKTVAADFAAHRP